MFPTSYTRIVGNGANGVTPEMTPIQKSYTGIVGNGANGHQNHFMPLRTPSGILNKGITNERFYEAVQPVTSDVLPPVASW